MIQLTAGALAEFGRLGARMAREPDEWMLWYVVDPEGRRLEHWGMTSGHDHTVNRDFRQAIGRVNAIADAAGVVLLHNHPRFHDEPEAGGRPTPSERDIRFTAWVQQQLKESNIELLDHVIVGMVGADNSSMRDAGLPETGAVSDFGNLADVKHAAGCECNGCAEAEEARHWRRSIIESLKRQIELLEQLKEALRG